MAITPSTMTPLGIEAPDFSLLNPLTGQQLDRDSCRGQHGLLVMFICNHCPFVLHIENELLQFGGDYRESGIGIVAISANDATDYPEDGPDKMAGQARSKDYPFPYLYDESQQVAKAYQAACTPDFFLYDSSLSCVYRGRFDASTPGNDTRVTGQELRQAMDCVVAGRPVSHDQKASMGCNINGKNNSEQPGTACVGGGDMSTIGFIGGGNMATALARGLMANGRSAAQIAVADPDPLARTRIATALPGVQVTEGNDAVFSRADTLILAVKPQQMETVASGLGSLYKSTADGPSLIISIAAGISLASLKKWLDSDVSLVRCMPNTPALVNCGITAIYADSGVVQQQRQLAQQLLGAVGQVVWVSREPLLDAVTAVSGSGPAYFFLMMDCLQQTALKLGLDAETARELSIMTALGAGRLATAANAAGVATLLKQVTSPGGTTERALEVLRSGHFEQLMDKAVRAAATQAQYLTEKFSP